jgi:hypothetical protein
MIYDDTNSGVLFKSNTKSEPKHCDYSGHLNVNGIDHWINGWLRESQNGLEYLRLTIKPKKSTAPLKTASPSKQLTADLPLPAKDASGIPFDDKLPF